MNVLTVIGTRPEAIKMAPVIHALAAHPSIKSTVCATGQHRDMLDPVLQAFGIVPDIDLHLMRPDQCPSEVTQRALDGLSAVIRQIGPDVVLVHGDTTSCLAGALAAFYSGIAIGHVEAGLRSGDLSNPFPEEGNRVLVDRLAHWHFAPTDSAKANLIDEGRDPKRILVTGNTGIDALLWIRDQLPSPATREANTPLVLVTAHRRESHGAGLANICEGIRRLCRARPDLRVVFPVHRNPNVHNAVHAALADVAQVQLTGPLPYPEFVALLWEAALVLTDSGGIQEECPTTGTRVLVLRDRTERTEGIEAGGAILVGTDPDRICHEAVAALQRPPLGPNEHNPYGDGHAANRIVQALVGAE